MKLLKVIAIGFVFFLGGCLADFILTGLVESSLKFPLTAILIASFYEFGLLKVKS